MALPFSTRISEIYVLTAGQTGPFTQDWPLFAASDLLFLRRRALVTAPLVLGVDYTLSGHGVASEGFSATLLAGAEDGDQVVLIGARDVARITTYTGERAVTPGFLNIDFNMVFAQLQEMQRDVARAFKADLFDPAGAFDFEGRRLTNVGPPVDAGDAVTRGSIDAQLSAAVSAATAASQDAANATAADRHQTGLDRAATGADRVQTGLDRIAASSAADISIASRAAAEALLGIGRQLQVGQIMYHSLASTPPGWMRITRDPQALAKSEFPELNARYAVEGYPYGSDESTFNIPGGAGLFVRAWDDDATHDPDAASRLSHDGAATAGNVLGSRQGSENKSHAHGITQTPHTHPFTDNQGVGGGSGVQGGNTHTLDVATPDITGGGLANITINSAGGSESRPANIALPLIILVSPSNAAAQHTPFGLPYLWDSSIASASPGTGRLRLNNANPALATEMLVALESAHGADLAELWTSLNAVPTTPRALMTITHAGAPANMAVASVMGDVVVGGDYVRVPISVMAFAGSWTADAPLCVQLSVSGGAKGNDGAGIEGGVLRLTDLSEHPENPDGGSLALYAVAGAVYAKNSHGTGGQLAVGEAVKWLSKGIGEYYIADTGETGVDIPPKDPDDGMGVWVELTADLTGSGQFNAGKLVSQSVTGAAPLVIATAVVNWASSPMHGQTIRLLNTERRFLRAGSAGTVENDQMQTITGRTHYAWGAAGAPEGAFSVDGTSTAVLGTSVGNPSTRLSFNSGNSPGARAGTETRPKNIGVRVFRRIG